MSDHSQVAHPAVSGGADLDAALPATAAQREVWVAQNVDPSSPVYNIGLVVEVDGTIDVERAAASIEASVGRVEALFVHFEVDADNQLIQVPIPDARWDVEILDLRAEADPDSTAQSWMDTDMARVFGPDDLLFRQVLLLTADDRVIWYQRYHHSVVDGYGISLIVADVAERYDDPNLGTAAPQWSLDAVVAADLDYRNSPRFQTDRQYWVERVESGPEATRILHGQVDDSLPPISAMLTLDADRAAQLYRYAADAGIRRTRLPMAALIAYIARTTGKHDVVVSVPMAARVGRDMRRTPSMASTILPLSIRVERSETIGQLATRLDTALISILKHGRYRGEDLARDIRAIDPDRQVFGPGINSMMFEHTLTFGGCPVRVRNSVTGRVSDLDLSVRGGQDGEPIEIDVRAPSGFDRELADHTARIEQFLDRFVAEPQLPISALDPMASAERELVLHGWNDTAEPQPVTTVPELLRSSFSADRGAVAVVDGDVRLTYAELESRVSQLAAHLISRGVAPEIVVAIGLPRSAEMVVGLLAVMCAGGAFVPLDPSWPAERRESVLTDAGATLVLTSDGVDDSVPVDLSAWAYEDGPSDLSETMTSDIRIHGAQLAYVIFTSGSTGRPKGAMIRHEAICARLLWQRERILGFGSGDASLFKAPLSFDISINEILLPLVSGGRLVIAKPEGERDPQYLLDLIAGESVTFVYLVSSMLDILLDLANETDQLDSLKHVWCGGEVLTPELFDRFRAQLSTTLYHGYGPAEATIGVSHVIYREDAERIATSIGRPNPNTRLYVLDGDLQPVPIGTGGELYAAGFLLGRGYVGASALTASRFVADPFVSGDLAGSRMYRTGDLARWAPDGTLDFLGRTDNQVKIRGMRLELEDVEAAVISHPAVRHVAVLVRQAPTGAKYLAAYVSAASGTNLAIDSRELREWAASKLPDYMVPTTVTVLDKFPLTANGKLDRRALPEPDLAELSAHIAARNEVEQQFCTLIASAVGLDSVGVTDDFFALGGDSIVAIALVTAARAAGLSISPREVFQLRTAEAMARAQSSRVAEIVDHADQPIGHVATTPIAARVLGVSDAVRTFHQRALIQTPSALTSEHVQAALDALVARHDALRATLTPEGRLLVPETNEVAVVFETRALPAPLEECGPLIVAETERAVGRLNPADGTMVSAVLFRPVTGPGRLLLVIHHAVVDGVSWRIILEDLARAGIAAMNGDEPALAPVGTSVRRYAELVSDAVGAGRLDSEIEFWDSVTSAQRASLGRRALDPAVDLARTAAARSITLPPELADQLLGSVPRAFGADVSEVLVTALAVALTRWSGAGSVTIDLEGHGRDEDIVRGDGAAHVDLTRTVGWFTTVFPVALEIGTAAPDLEASGELAGVLKSVKEQLRRVPNAGFGYGALRYLGGSDQLRSFAAPEVVLNYLGRTAAAEGDWFPVSMDGAADPSMPLGHALSVDVVAEDAAGGPRLRATLTWASNIFLRSDIDRFARLWLDSLEAVSGLAAFGGATPSDYPLVALAQADVDGLPKAEEILPLTPLQEGIYFHSAFADPGADQYVVQQVVELTGAVDSAALRRALQSVVDRHEALRTGFSVLGDGRVVQVVHPSAVVEMAVVEVAGADVDELLSADRARGFDLAQPPLVRYTLVRASSEKYLLLQSIHHAVADGWSVPVMLRELMASYSVGDSGVVLPTPAPYRSYLEWLAGHDHEASAAVWREALNSPGPAVELPAPSAGSSGICATRVELSDNDTRALAINGRSHGLTLSTLVHGAWGLVLGRMTGRTDVLFGSTVSGRGGDLPGIESMVGLFINTVPARLRFDPAETAAQALSRWQREQSELLDHQYLGLPELRRTGGLEQDFESLVVFENYPLGDTAIADPTNSVRLTGIRFDERPAYPLTLIVVPGDRLALELKYDAAQVDGDAAASLAETLAVVLTELSRDLDQVIGRIALAPAQPGSVGTALDRPRATLTELLKDQAGRTPEATAVIFREESLTYAELHSRADRFAHLLRERGVGRESLVAVALPRSLDLMVAILGIGKAGGAYVPLDTGYPAERLTYMLGDADPVCVVVSEDSSLDSGSVPRVTVSESAQFPADPLSVPGSPADAAYMIYTSGSTGRPKGVVVNHEGVVNRLLWAQQIRPMDVSDRMLQKTPSSFDVSVPEFFWPFLVGATLVMAEPDGHKDPGYLADVIVEHSVTRVHFVPSMLDVFLAEPKAALCSSLEIVNCSGEALPVHVARKVSEILPNTLVDNLYGPTEAAVDVSWQPSVQETPADAVSVPIGAPAANTGLLVLDPYLQNVPAGATGELYLAGPQLARGYHGRGGLTSERFVANPYSDGGSRMYRTGDIVRWNADGVLEYLGRADEQVKVRGFRIELGEIEAQLALCPGVTASAVIVRTDGPSNRAQVVAYLVGDADDVAVRAQLLSVLPEFMVPSAFVRLESLPLSPSGKLDRKALPAPDFAAQVGDLTGVVSSGVADLLAGHFATVLGLPRVGVRDDFFTLGGDSILAIRLVNLARRDSVVLTPRQIFELRTPAAIAAAVGDVATSDATVTADIGVGELVPLPVVHRLSEWTGGTDRFNQAVLIHSPATSLGSITGALQAVLDHHDGLRQTLIRHDRGMWSARIEEPGSVRAANLVERVDARGLDDSELRRLVTEHSETATSRLDPSAGRMVSVVWFDCGAESLGRLAIVAHHLVVDGVSWGTVLEDLAMAWVAVEAGEPAALDAVGTSLRTFSRTVAEHAYSAHRFAELDHWLTVTAPGAQLIPDAAGDAVVSGGSRRTVTVDGAISEAALGSVAAMVGAEGTDVLLAALTMSVDRWRRSTGRSEHELLVDLERHGREELVAGIDLSRTVGWFTTIAPMRLHGGIDPVDTLREVKESLRAAPDGGIGYGMLRYVNARTASTLAGRSESQILFNYLGRTTTAGSTAWSLAAESEALSTDPDADMGGPYRLIVNVVSVDSGLRAEFAWASEDLSEEDAQSLSDGWVSALGDLAAAAARHAGPPILTPSDVTLLDLSQTEIDAIADASPAGVSSILPLSPLQEGLYFQAGYAGSSDSSSGGDIYTAQFSMDFGHTLDVDRLAAAARTLQRRNPTLRAGFVSEGLNEPVQFFSAGLDVPVVVHDLRELDDSVARERAEAVAAQDRVTPFDLTAPPLWRMSVLHLPGGQDRLVINRQFLLWDGWSNGLVVSQLLALYDTGGDDSAFGEPEGSFETYLAWLADRDGAAADEGWRGALAGLEEPTLVAEPMPGVEVQLPDRRDAVLSETLSRALRERAAASGVTFNTVLNAALALVLASATGRQDVVFGSTVAGRPPEVPGIDTVVGMFLNTVPVRLQLDPNESVEELLRRTQADRLSLMPFDYLGLASIQRVSEHRQLFDVLMVLQNFVDERQVHALNAAHDVSGSDSIDHTHYPLTVVVTPGATVNVKFEFHPHLVTARRAEDLLGHFVDLLQSWSQDMTGSVVASPVPAVAQQTQIRELPERTIADLFEEVASAQPNDTALVFGKRRMTYADLDGEINRMARLLINYGAGPEKIVALGLPRSVDMVVALFAVLRTGAAYLPLELDHPAERLAVMIDDADPVVLLTTVSASPRFEGADVRTIVIDEPDTAARRLTISARALSASELGAFAPGAPHRLDHPAYVIYTSGSTGKPKGVVTGYRGLTNMQFNHREAIFEPVIAAAGRRLRIAHTVSFAFDMSWEELLWLVEGHEVHICDEDLRRDAEALVAYCDALDIDVVNVTPTYATHLIDSGLLDDGVGHHRPPLVLLGGEAVPDSVWNRLRDTEGTVGYNLYGPTEYTINTLGGGTFDSDTPTVGKPIWNTAAHILDGWLRPVPDGVAGELYIAGAGLARGYLGRFALTSERFVADPAGTGGRMYRTGDLVRRRGDGNLDFLGRTDDQVKIRGHRIEPSEIVSVLESDEHVRQAAVVVDVGAGGVKRLVGYVTPVRLGAGHDYRAQARVLLPDYMVPAVVIEVETLPMTVNGKLDVKALPTADSVLGERSGESIAPRNHTEEVLCDLFSDVLDVGDIGVDDNFFDLGGHSLLATKLISRARIAIPNSLTMRDLFEAPTVAELAERIVAEQGSTRPVLVAKPRPDHLPLSAAQQRLWLIGQMEENSAAYNFPIVLRLDGALDADVFAAALGDVVERHESLRTVFRLVDGSPEQIILESATIPVETVHRDESGVAGEIAVAVGRPFDLSDEIPIRARLIRVDGDEVDGAVVVVIVLHHITTDEWSDRPFLRDLMSAYSSRIQGEDPIFEPLPVQYADYTLWQRELLGSPDDPSSILSTQLDFWAKSLDGAPEELLLPADRSRPARPSFSGGAVVTRLGVETTAALRDLARESRSSMFMVLHAASAALLTALGAGEDLPLGAPVAGRSEQGLDELVGFFVNTIVLRTDTSGNPTFRELVDRVREGDLEAFANADVPFETVVERLNPSRTLARNPLFQVMVGYHSREETGGDSFELEEYTAKFDLVFNFTEYLGDEGCIDVRLEYGSDLFDRETAQRISNRLESVIAAVVESADIEIGDIDIFLPGELEQVVTSFNDTAVDVPEETFYDAFARGVVATPEAIAVRDEAGQATYRELSEQCDRIAGVLYRRGVSVEDVVGLAVPRSVEMVASVLAVLKLGAAYLPLDLSHPSERITYMLTDSRASVLLSTAEESSRIEDVVGVERILLDDPLIRAELDEAVIVETPRPPVGVSHAAYVIYTSGSTGKPKGAVLSHDGIPSLVATAEVRMRLVSGSVVMQFASVGFDVAVFELAMALCTSSTLVIVPQNARVAGPALTDFMTSNRVTHAIIPPSLLAALPAGCEVPQGCTVLVGTETVPPELIGRWAERLNLLAAYGLTEATVNNTLWQAEPGWNGPVPIGIPDPNEQAYVLDDQLRPVPPGVSGELYIAGRGLARGYLGRFDLTAQRFIADPYTAGDRMYRTGDRARWRTDGNIDFLGRVDDQVKIRGFRIELGEIIGALSAHPSVKQATVVADRQGEITRLVGYVSPEPGVVVDTTAVRNLAALSLPDYMVPTMVVALDGPLPLTPNGKLDRKSLPTPDWSELAGDVAPRTAVESTVAAAFAEILQLPSVGVHDSFFELGGHSMASMKLVGRIREAFGVDVSIRDVFDAPSVAELAAVVARSEGGRPILAPAVKRPETMGLSAPQRRQWELFRASGAQPQASHALALTLKSKIDPEILGHALDDVTSRHEPLRTTFVEVDGIVVARESVRPTVDVVDVGAGDVGRVVFELAQLPMDLREQSPLRVHLVLGEDGSRTLLLVMHYIAVDEWSVVPLLGDLVSAYAARSQGDQPVWDELALTYADYTVWSDELLGDPRDVDSRASKQLAYWRDALDGIPTSVNLPLPEGDSEPRGDVIAVDIDAGLHAGIDALAARTGTSMFMVLQAALASVLTKAGAGTDLPIGSLVAGRSDPRLEPMIGSFFNVVLLRTDTSGSPTFAELLGRVRERNLEALNNQDVSYVYVEQALGNPASMRPQVMVIHHQQADLDGLGDFGSLVPIPVGVPHADVTLSFYEPVGDGPVFATLGFRADRVDAGAVRVWAGQLVDVIEAAVAAEGDDASEGAKL